MDGAHLQATTLLLWGQVIMTGHSLGGAIAKIVAARVDVPVVGISSPGIASSHRWVGINCQRDERDAHASF